MRNHTVQPVTVAPLYRVGQIVETGDHKYGRITSVRAAVEWNKNGVGNAAVRYYLTNGKTVHSANWDEYESNIARVISEDEK